jgi:hypothetical protein
LIQGGFGRGKRKRGQILDVYLEQSQEELQFFFFRFWLEQLERWHYYLLGWESLWEDIWVFGQKSGFRLAKYEKQKRHPGGGGEYAVGFLSLEFRG